MLWYMRTCVLLSGIMSKEKDRETLEQINKAIVSKEFEQ